MAWVEILGLAAGALTTLAFVPQVIRAHRSRATRDLSLPMLVLFNAGIGLWLAYGLLIGSGGLILANAVTGVLSLYILSLKLRFG
ncbi:SemiSWEET family sugar transporter [Roseomonas sp. CCTCC AB2023176]|uniref:SemiSWEET family sugar transporter n=1 Tax=Roseomonas sp. CCTCC AB2023176 TaxID=3342640 RepID=UPI0035E0C859